MVKFQINLKNNKVLALEPAKIIVFSFAAVIFWGALLLSLPIASKPGQESVSFLTALFTATSATCVTGLVVVDTFTQWSLFGQIVILTLIQIGALGFVTFATFFSILLGRKVGLKTMILAQESLNHFSFEGILRLIKNVVITTFIIELIGALILSTRFVPRFGPKGFYMAVFHAISAFCNAGFDIMGQVSPYSSLTTFNEDPVVLYTVSGLVILGGLGFMVWKDLVDYRKTRELLLHTKVVLVVTAFLITLGTLFFFVFEFNNPNTLASLSFPTKINAAFFHSVATRTAGFNSISIDKMNEISKVATILFMFIGAAPGSTGGGVKITTFGVLMVAIISQVRGSNDTIIFKRKVPHTTVIKSLAIIGLSAMLVITVTTLLLIFENNRTFLDILYEATSAFGTVGLSSVGTFTLHTASRIFLIVTMFLGRVGPLSFAIALALRSNKKNQDLVYPEGKIVVG
ncbi:MAG: TrkH family potassium uptake protein [Bacillota bacterium]